MSGDHIWKAFRPSRLVNRDPMDEQSTNDKEVKLAEYLMRAQAGLPLFDASSTVTDMNILKKRH